MKRQCDEGLEAVRHDIANPAEYEATGGEDAEWRARLRVTADQELDDRAVCVGLLEAVAQEGGR